MGRRGVFKTKDGGRSWQAMNTGLRGLRVSVLAIARTKPEVVYAGTCSCALVDVGLPHRIPRRTPLQGLFKSTNGGRSWHAVLKLHPNASDEVRDVAVEPKHPATIWVTTYGFVRKSLDGGRTWLSGVGGCTARACQLPGPMGAAGPGFPHIAVSPRTPRIVYLGAGGGIFRSPNGGRRWTGHPVPQGSTFTGFAFDPLDADTLFVSTNRGVYKRAEDGRGWQAIGSRARTFSLAIDSQGTTLYVGTRRGVLAYQLRP
jgi:photosystem II stability/assembly factor-like uncharacterized protein